MHGEEEAGRTILYGVTSQEKANPGSGENRISKEVRRGVNGIKDIKDDGRSECT
jgi:hypothetical protein